MKRLSGMLIIFVLILGLADFAGAEAKIKGMDIKYKVQDVQMKGYIAYDESIKGKQPGVLVVDEWWGLTDYGRKRARMLAELGYTALVVDMYGEGKTATHPDDAKSFSSGIMKNFDVAKERVMAGLNLLKSQSTVDPSRIAAIGYCFGGGIVLNMARQGVDLKGVVSFHGSLAAVKPAQPGSVKAKILVLNGADDKFTTKEQIEAFMQEMKNANADFRFISYPGAVHSFTNPDADELGKKFKMPIAYNREADEKSWEELKEFLVLIFSR
ncbi:MAG TPA: dienelactone hydrolase family protein [Syntrophales bacterium]|nr:dienelactone hydrolase family protein [Syntrophales bacterium]